MFESIPRTRVISEPYSFLFVWNMYLRGEISYVEYEKLLQSTFQVQCKKEKGIQQIVIKHTMAATPCINTLKTIFPKSKLLFITRHPLPSLKSYDKLWTLLPVSGTIGFLANMNGIYWKNYPIPCNDVVWWERYRGIIEEGCTFDQKIAMIRVFFFNYWCVVEQYIKNKKLYEKAVFYEDLCDSPRKVLDELFAALDISNDNIETALDVMATDSQKGIFGKRGSSTSSTSKHIPKIIELLDKKFAECDIPIKMRMPMQDFRNIL